MDFYMTEASSIFLWGEPGNRIRLVTTGQMVGSYPEDIAKQADRLTRYASSNITFFHVLLRREEFTRDGDDLVRMLGELMNLVTPREGEVLNYTSHLVYSTESVEDILEAKGMINVKTALTLAGRAAFIGSLVPRARPFCSMLWGASSSSIRVTCSSGRKTSSTGRKTRLLTASRSC